MLRQRRQAELQEEGFVLGGGFANLAVDASQFLMRCSQIDLLLADGGADVAADVETIVLA